MRTVADLAAELLPHDAAQKVSLQAPDDGAVGGTGSEMAAGVLKHERYEESCGLLGGRQLLAGLVEEGEEPRRGIGLFPAGVKGSSAPLGPSLRFQASWSCFPNIQLPVIILSGLLS